MLHYIIYHLVFVNNRKEDADMVPYSDIVIILVSAYCLPHYNAG